jgi:hypothetical protein
MHVSGWRAAQRSRSAAPPTGIGERHGFEMVNYFTIRTGGVVLKRVVGPGFAVATGSEHVCGRHDGLCCPFVALWAHWCEITVFLG